MTELLQYVWLAALTVYLIYGRVRAGRVVREVRSRHQRLDALKARRGDMEGLLTRLQSDDPATKVAAAKELIRRRAAK